MLILKYQCKLANEYSKSQARSRVQDLSLDGTIMDGTNPGPVVPIRAFRGMAREGDPTKKWQTYANQTDTLKESPPLELNELMHPPLAKVRILLTKYSWLS